MNRFPILSAALAAFVLSTPALAQESTTRGLNLAVHLTGSGLDIEGGAEREDGAGAGILVGYGVNRNVMIFLQLEGAGFMVDNASVEGEWTMGHADLGARFHFGNTTRSWVPYLQAALSGRAVTVDRARINNVTYDQATFNGGGFSLGGGLLVYPWETVAFELQLVGTGGRFTEIKRDNVTISGLEIEATSGRFSVGLSWWP
jgi:hypothetical protein